MNWTPETKAFIHQHQNDDTDRLLLSAHRYVGIDVLFAVDQIQSRRQIKNKLPEWFANEDIVMSGRVPAEQCSSEQTAKYKRDLVLGDTLCDMTGGMGVDLYYMSRGLQKAVYTERQPLLCKTATHNFAALKADNIEIREGDGRTLPIPDVDTIYLDPARRAADGSRVYDLADCEPNVVEWQNDLLLHCKRLIVKMSPMVDVSRVLDLLPSITQLHIVSSKGECKEVLAVCDKNPVQSREQARHDVEIFCVDFKSNGKILYSYKLNEERCAESVFAEKIGNYLYEPDVSVLKAGAYKSLCASFDVQKLDVNSHLYTSVVLRDTFPGRVFEIEESVDFSSKSLKTLKRNIPQANITARNFVMTADQLRTRTGIKDGGDVYLFASTMKGIGNIILKCKKVLTLLLLFVCLGGNFVTAKDKNPETIEQLVSGVSATSPLFWHSGMEFYFLNEEVNMLLVPEVKSLEPDDTNYKGTIWTFDAVVSEEDWMGQQTMALRFISPLGKAYRFSTERLLSQSADTTYIPTIPGLYPKEIIDQVSQLVCARTLYILLNDDRISDGDSIKFDKFKPVVVDSVSYGTELAPLRIYYTFEDGSNAYVMTSLPGSRENATSTPLNRYFSITDPYLSYPEITRKTWDMICKSEIAIDMTREECRLSWGKPMRFESFNTRNGVVERWFYSGSRVLEFVGGRLVRIGREK